VLNIEDEGRPSGMLSAGVSDPQAFLNAEQRGGTAPNGKPSMTIEEAGFHLVGGGPGWGGVLGQAYEVVYSFRSTAPTTMPGDTGGFSRFNAAQIAQTELALLAWGDVARISFMRAGNGTAGEEAYSNLGSIQFANYATGAEGAAAFGNYPGDPDPASSSGDVWVNSSLSYNTRPVQGGYGALVLVHEIGHAIGLTHPGDYDASDDADITYAADAEYYEDSQQFTVMSYFDETNTGASYGAAYGAAPMLDDISAAQQEYGANYATRAGDTVYGFNSTADRPWFLATNSNSTLIFAAWDAGGVDTFDFSGFSNTQVIDLQAGHFSSVGGLVGNVAIAANVVIEDAIGGAAADVLTGNASGNALYGRGGNDQLDGLAGNDHLTGGTGSDALQGGGGFDFARYDAAAAGVVVNLATGSGTAGEAAGDTLTGVEGLVGSSFGDVLWGEAGANSLFGLAGDDTLVGGASGDTLDGGDGTDQLYGGPDNDYLIGGAGFDYARYDPSSAGVSVNLATGLGAGGEAAGDVLSGVEGAVGSAFGDVLTGDAGANTFFGLGGDDTLFGGASGDTLDGGDGNDMLNGGAANDYVIGGAGFDYARYDASSAGVIVNLATGLGSAGEAGGDVFSGVEGAVGSAFSDFLTGDAGSNVFFGLGGSDSMFGAAGDDTLDGAAGSDTLSGDEGADHLYGGADGDVLAGGAGFDFARYDNAVAGVTVNLSTGSGTAGEAAGDMLISVEGLVGSQFGDDLTGDAGANTIFGVAGDDALAGGAAGDTLDGGDGADHLYGGADNDYLTGGAGFDFARYDNAAAGVSVDLLVGLGSAGEAAGDVLSGVEGLVGSAFGDLLVGDGGGNTIYALAGADTLQGGGGGDVLIGGAGADRFVYVATGDSAPAAADQILDFSLAEGDRVDLSAVDANTGLAGDQAFALVGAFSNQAGQAVLAYDAGRDTTSLGLDVNGDSQIDFQLILNGRLTTAEGFLL
jgi:serralysin